MPRSKRTATTTPRRTTHHTPHTTHHTPHTTHHHRHRHQHHTPATAEVAWRQHRSELHDLQPSPRLSLLPRTPVPAVIPWLTHAPPPCIACCRRCSAGSTAGLQRSELINRVCFGPLRAFYTTPRPCCYPTTHSCAALLASCGRHSRATRSVPWTPLEERFGFHRMFQFQFPTTWVPLC